VPTGRVKWYDAAKGFGFVTSDEGGDVFLPKAMGVKLIDAPPSLAELRRRPADQLHSMIEDMIKVLEQQVQPSLSRGRYPDKKTAQTIAQVVHAVAREFEI
jgi:CspA family cold shock protein